MCVYIYNFVFSFTICPLYALLYLHLEMILNLQKIGKNKNSTKNIYTSLTQIHLLLRF